MLKSGSKHSKYKEFPLALLERWAPERASSSNRTDIDQITNPRDSETDQKGLLKRLTKRM